MKRTLCSLLPLALLLLLLLQSMDVCSAKQRAMYLDRLISNMNQLSYYHTGLFLGETPAQLPSLITQIDS
jgi:hypothetical protein